MDGPQRWLADREPPAPEELRRRLEIGFRTEGSLREALCRAALHHRDEALARLGRNRGGAYHLLAADALLTYACEVASEEEDPEDGLIDLFERFHTPADGPTTSTDPHHAVG